MTLHTSRGQADHSSYVAAVRQDIETQGISLTDVRIGVSPEGRREAFMRLEPGDSTSLGQPLLEASIRWDEEHGWSFLARYDTVPLLRGSPLYKGLGVLPDPDDVAVWVVALLANPAMIPSREDGPYRLCSSADPAFNAQLTRYSFGQ